MRPILRMFHDVSIHRRAMIELKFSYWTDHSEGPVVSSFRSNSHVNRAIWNYSATVSRAQTYDFGAKRGTASDWGSARSKLSTQMTFEPCSNFLNLLNATLFPVRNYRVQSSTLNMWKHFHTVQCFNLSLVLDFPTVHGTDVQVCELKLAIENWLKVRLERHANMIEIESSSR